MISIVKAIGFLFLIQYCCSEPIQKNLRLKRQPPITVANELSVNGIIENAVRNVFRTNGFALPVDVVGVLNTQRERVLQLATALLPIGNNFNLQTLNDFSRFIFGPEFGPLTQTPPETFVNDFATRLGRLQAIFNAINNFAPDCTLATADPNAACQTARANRIQPIINRVQNERESNFDLVSFLNGNNRQFPQGNPNLPRNPDDVLLQNLINFLNQRLP